MHIYIVGYVRVKGYVRRILKPRACIPASKSEFRIFHVFSSCEFCEEQPVDHSHLMWSFSK